MNLIRTYDKNAIEGVIRHDRVRALYHLGDLDDYYFRKCKFYFVTERERYLAVISLYKTWGTTLLPLGEPKALRFFLEEHDELLTDEFYAVWMPEHDSVMSDNLELRGKRSMYRMTATSETFQPCASNHQIVALKKSHIAGVRTLLRSYPGNFFEEYQLETGFYRGIFEDGTLVAMAGVHTINRKTGVVAVGNVVTDEHHRGRGLAREVTSKLVEDLLKDHEFIGLNVNMKNVPAIRAYKRLGFEIRLEFFEGECRKKHTTVD